MFLDKNQHLSSLKNINVITNKKKYNNSKTKKNLFHSNIKFHLKPYNFYFNVPMNWSVVILNSNFSNYKIIYLYNNVYFFKFITPKMFSNLYFDYNTHTIVFNSIFINTYYKLYWFYLNQLFSILNKPQFNKIKFKGKGYYIYKNKRNTITPQFGFAHRIFIYAFFLNVKFLSKTSIFVFGFLKQDIIYLSNNIKSTRPINIFTGRGVRFSRAIVYKKQGKVSSYR